jgi:hypothetical protein
MLDQMRQPADAVVLRPRSDFGIESNRDGFSARERIDRDGQAIGKDVHRGSHDFDGSFMRLRTATT